MEDSGRVIFAAGTVEGSYGGVAVAIHSARDVTVGDWMPSVQAYLMEAERAKEVRDGNMPSGAGSAA